MIAKTLLLYVVLGVGLFGGLLPVAAAPARPTLTIVLPQDAEPEKIKLLLFASGAFGGIGEGNIARKGIYRYQHTIRAGSSEVKVFIYRPGYNIVTAVFSGNMLKSSFTVTPKFIPLRWLTVQGTVTDGQGKPLPGETIVFQHFLGEHPFFNIMDGFAAVAQDAQITSGPQGEFTVQLPSLSEDPYYKPAEDGSPYAVPPFNLVPSQRQYQRDWDFVPIQLNLKPDDEKTLLQIRKLYRAKLIVRITEEFRKWHKLLPTDELWVIVGESGSRSMGGSRVNGNEYIRMLTPGTYRVHVEVERNNKRIAFQSLAEQLELHEREEYVLTAK